MALRIAVFGFALLAILLLALVGLLATGGQGFSRDQGNSYAILLLVGIVLVPALLLLLGCFSLLNRFTKSFLGPLGPLGAYQASQRQEHLGKVVREHLAELEQDTAGKRGPWG